ncbi:MAG: hypothetical protein QOJ13_1187 [Gaiellales bacterium]|jgi:hypothetical protein|nr:hypothetical protein [Gaiellales bacterium]
MSTVPAPRLLGSLRGLPVMVADHLVGAVTGVLLDAERTSVLGFELESVSGRRYFLPLALARVAETAVVASSPLHLVDDVEHYVRRGAVAHGPDESRLAVDLTTGKVLSAESPAALGPATPR